MSLLKLNQVIELIVFGPKHGVNDFSICHLSFDGTVVSDVSCVRNLGYIRQDTQYEEANKYHR